MEKCLACVCTMAVNRNGKYRAHRKIMKSNVNVRSVVKSLDFIANKMPKTHDTIRNALIRLTENATGKIKFDVTFYSNERTNEKPSINEIASDYNGDRDTEQISRYNNKIY